jgi:diguanylate cyclase (GGDEF)-like protein
LGIHIMASVLGAALRSPDLMAIWRGGMRFATASWDSLMKSAKIARLADSPRAAALAIPKEEFTPRVRKAIEMLMREVERLSRESQETRTQLDDLIRTADQDMLLPVLNRRAFMREISRFIAFAERYGTQAVLLYFDLDHFKSVNDAHGHAAGDAVLRHFCTLLSDNIRDSDVLGRVGGDEFAVILAHSSLQQAKEKGAALMRHLRQQQPFWNGREVPLTFSCGAYELRAGQTADCALAEADRAMYAQKRTEERAVKL